MRSHYINRLHRQVDMDEEVDGDGCNGTAAA